jgi:hypothetical protein
MKNAKHVRISKNANSQVMKNVKVKVILWPTVGQSVSLSWCQATIRAHDQFFFLLEMFLRQLWVCYFMAPSLRGGQVCNLFLLLGLASAIPLGSESRGTQDHILLFQFLRLPQPGGPGPHIYIPPGQGGHWVPFPSPLTTRRAMVEVF